MNSTQITSEHLKHLSATELQVAIALLYTTGEMSANIFIRKSLEKKGVVIS